MATIGYGDVTPVRGLGWIVAGFAAIMGIIAYTLTISVIADWFLSLSIRRSMGMAPLKNKSIIIIGDSPACQEIIDELILNELGEKTGWLTPVKPRGEPPVDYMIGDPRDLETLKKAGTDKAEHIVLCLKNDSKTLHTTLIIRKINKQAKISAITSKAEMEDLLKQAGANHVLSQKILGRTIASAIFEPEVLTILTDIISKKGKGDLIQEKITQKQAGKTIKEIEEEKTQKDKKYNYKAIALIRNQEYIIAPPPNTKLQENDTIIYVKGLKNVQELEL